MKTITYRMLVAFSVMLALSGCDSSGSESSSAAAVKDLTHLSPSDPMLKSIYDRSCKACHGLGTPAIPQTGDVEAWEPRMAQGMDVLLDHVINGYGGMPPLGMCMDCDADQFESLIEFMAKGSG